MAETWQALKTKDYEPAGNARPYATTAVDVAYGAAAAVVAAVAAAAVAAAAAAAAAAVAAVAVAAALAAAVAAVVDDGGVEKIWVGEEVVVIGREGDVEETDE